MDSVCKGLEKDKCLPPKCKYASGKKLSYCRKNTTKINNVRPVSSNPVTHVPSECKGLEKDKCLPPKCKYASGKKLSYCRKNTTKIKGTSKRVTPKQATPKQATPKRSAVKNKSVSLSPSPPPNRIPMSFTPPGYEEEKEHSPQRINQDNDVPRAESKSSSLSFHKKTSSSHKKTSSSHKKSSSSTQKRIKNEQNKTKKGNIIKKFIVKNKNKLTAYFLNAICQDSGVCMAFGKEINKIKSFFNNFTTFEYAVNQRYISTGSNGVVVQIEYERLKYKSFAILKQSQQTTSDNVFYEYLVGKFLNLKNKKLPCLLETYGMFFTPTGLIDNFNTLETIHTQTGPQMYNALTKACLHPKKILLLIEHIKGAQTLRDKINMREFVSSDLIHSLFQVYFTLNALKDVFTHYDLHCQNVLTYIPIQNKYIEYHFHFQNEIISFKSPYLIKIIDYGRCYFDNQNGFDSESVYNQITSINCGVSQGFSWFDKSKQLKKRDYYINNLILNRSHDLRLLKDISLKMNMTFLEHFSFNPTVDRDVKTLFTKFVFSELFGTDEKLNSGLPQKLNNVADVFTILKKICMNPHFQIDNENQYSSAAGARRAFTKIGDLHIYQNASNKDMVFTPS